MKRALPASPLVGVASYTNLAELASGFEAAYQRHVVAPANVGSDATPTRQALHAQAMQLIQRGLSIDEDSPVQAAECYQQGAELLSRALEGAPPDDLSDEMQRACSMCTERVRTIARERMRDGGAVSRSDSESQFAAATPAMPPTVSGLLEHAVDTTRPELAEPPTTVAEREPTCPCGRNPKVGRQPTSRADKPWCPCVRRIQLLRHGGPRGAAA